MTQLSIFIFGILTGMGAIMLFCKRKTGLIGEQARKKELHKQKIMEVLRVQKSVSNNDIEKLLSVSDSTATRYLNELEKESLIVQKGGEDGPSVRYELK